MKDTEIKLMQMDILFDVKLRVKKKISAAQISKNVKAFEIDKLVSEIKSVKMKLRRANKKHKQGKIEKGELFDTEWYLYELQQELQALKKQQQKSSE